MQQQQDKLKTIEIWVNHQTIKEIETPKGKFKRIQIIGATTGLGVSVMISAFTHKSNGEQTTFFTQLLDLKPQKGDIINVAVTNVNQSDNKEIYFCEGKILNEVKHFSKSNEQQIATHTHKVQEQVNEEHTNTLIAEGMNKSFAKKEEEPQPQSIDDFPWEL